MRFDSYLCDGHSEVFGSDEYGNALLLIEGELPVELVAKARRAEGNCPERAISLIEDFNQ